MPKEQTSMAVINACMHVLTNNSLHYDPELCIIVAYSQPAYRLNNIYVPITYIRQCLWASIAKVAERPSHITT